MTLLTIAVAWLTLTAAGFFGLSVLARAERRKDLEADIAALEDRPSSDWSNADQVRMLADTRSLIARALLR